jgi:hypothetical protein
MSHAIERTDRPNRPTHVALADVAEIRRLELLARLAREQAASAMARSEALVAQRDLHLTRTLVALGAPLAAAVDLETGAIIYPPEPPEEVKAALAEAAAKA